MATYRLYIDESGTHSYANINSVETQYLCLLGVIIDREHNESYIKPKIEELRKIFTDDEDSPACFHYVDVVAKKSIFGKLRDTTVKDVFDAAYLDFIEHGDFVLCAIVLDKKTHLERYGDAAMHPYHYCLNVLLERYVKFLIEKNGEGDVMAESRGPKEDNLLKKEFIRFYNEGTSFVEPA